MNTIKHITIMSQIPYIKIIKYGLQNNFITTKTRLKKDKLETISNTVIKKFIDSKVQEFDLPFHLYPAIQWI